MPVHQMRHQRYRGFSLWHCRHHTPPSNWIRRTNRAVPIHRRGVFQAESPELNCLPISRSYILSTSRSSLGRVTPRSVLRDRSGVKKDECGLSAAKAEKKTVLRAKKVLKSQSSPAIHLSLGALVSKYWVDLSREEERTIGAGSRLCARKNTGLPS